MGKVATEWPGVSPDATLRVQQPVAQISLLRQAYHGPTYPDAGLRTSYSNRLPATAALSESRLSCMGIRTS